MLVIAPVAGAITAIALTGGAAMAAPQVTPLPCTASMSNSHPADYTTTAVREHARRRARIPPLRTRKVAPSSPRT